MCRVAGQSAFLHKQLYLSTNLDYLATLLGINSLSVLMCRKAVNQLTETLQWLVLGSLSKAGWTRFLKYVSLNKLMYKLTH